MKNLADRIPILCKADDKFPDHAGTSEAEKLILHALIRYYLPELVVEVGVSSGHMTLWLAGAIKANGTGHLVCVDNWSKNSGGAADNPGPAMRRLMAAGLEDVVTMVSEDSKVWLKDRPDSCADIVWIDGDHEYAAALQDIREGWRITRQLLLVHDVNQEYDMVRRAIADSGLSGVLLRAGRGIWIASKEGSHD